MSAILTSIRPPFDAYILPCPSIVGRRFRIAPLTTNDRCGFRVDRVICLSAHVPASPRHRLRLARVIPSLRKLPALHSGLPRQSHYLWLLPFALLRHPFCVGVSARSTSLPTRNLRLLFRPVRTGICSPASNRRTAAIRHHPPTHKRADERTEFSPWHSLHLSPRAGM